MRLGLGINKYKKVIQGASILNPSETGTLLFWYNFESANVTDSSLNSISNGEVVGEVSDLSGIELYILITLIKIPDATNPIMFRNIFRKWIS